MQIKVLIESKGSNVRVVFDPPLESMVQARQKRGDKRMAPAEFYAFLMADAVREASKKMDGFDPNKIITPGEF